MALAVLLVLWQTMAMKTTKIPSQPLPAAERAKTTLRLDPDFHKRLRILAIERGTSFEDLVNQACRDYLARHGKENRA